MSQSNQRFNILVLDGTAFITCCSRHKTLKFLKLIIQGCYACWLHIFSQKKSLMHTIDWRREKESWCQNCLGLRSILELSPHLNFANVESANRISSTPGSRCDNKNRPEIAEHCRVAVSSILKYFDSYYKKQFKSKEHADSWETDRPIGPNFFHKFSLRSKLIMRQMWQ